MSYISQPYTNGLRLYLGILSENKIKTLFRQFTILIIPYSGQYIYSFFI